jgi:hypothetical protein
LKKYIEELNPGNTFIYEQVVYVLTIDFKSNSSRLAYSIANGNPRWFIGNTIVEPVLLYLLDTDNNIIPLNTESKINENHSTIHN